MEGKLLNKAGMLTLINSVLISLTTYFFTILPPPKWLIKRIDKIRTGFLRKGDEDATVGNCAVNWRQVCSPKNCGGLGIKNLDLFSRALRIRWLWFAWERSSRPWIGSNTPCSPTDYQLFNASTTIILGNGATTSFWNRTPNGVYSAKTAYNAQFFGTIAQPALAKI